MKSNIAAPTQARQPWPAWLTFGLAGTPALVFYWLLARSIGNLPIVDDYYAVLNFTNHFSQLADLPSRLNLIINSQHNEYKLVFENLIFAAQYELFGSINFKALSMLGNAFVLALFVLLASVFRISTSSNAVRVLLLLPVALLLFQLQYASTLNFSMAGLQNIPVLVFALRSITLLTHNSPPRFAGACAAMLLAVAASGSGFLLAPVGGMMLLERRRWKHLAVWSVISVAIALVYFSNYNFHSSQSNPEGTIAESTAHLSITYLLAFIGSSVARYQGYVPSIIVGIVLLATWAFATYRGYSKENPSAFYFVIFLILTAAGVAAIRSRLGLEQSLASRYRIYSNLLLILSYIFFAESYLLRTKNRVAQLTVIGSVVACGLVFFALSNMAGYRFLNGRRQAVAYEMAAWQASVLNTAGRANAQEALNFDPAVSRQLAIGLYKPVSAVLTESIRLGVYRPPEPADLRLNRVSGQPN